MFVWHLHDDYIMSGTYDRMWCVHRCIISWCYLFFLLQSGSVEQRKSGSGCVSRGDASSCQDPEKWSHSQSLVGTRQIQTKVLLSRSLNNCSKPFVSSAKNKFQTITNGSRSWIKQLFSWRWLFQTCSSVYTVLLHHSHGCDVQI